jgi:hypothetical protein
MTRKKVITLNSEAYKTRKGEERLKKFIEGASQGWEITSDDITFTSRLFAQVGLPHTNKRTEIWERRNGQYIFTVRSGLDYQKKIRMDGMRPLIGIPYGRYPRLILSHIIDQALTYKRREIELTHSLAGYLKKLGVSTSGAWVNTPTGKRTRSTREECVMQLRRFISAEYTIRKIHYDTNGEMLECDDVRDLKISSRYRLWGPKTNPDQEELWPSFIILTEEFYNEIIEHAVPLYKGALRELEAAFALDIYMWSTFRAAYFEKYDKKECVRIPWAALKNQFGADYKQLKTFRYWFRHYLAEVRTIYPGLRIDDTDSDFLIFEPCKPHIPSQKLYLAKSTSK